MWVMALDVGTSSARARGFDAAGRALPGADGRASYEPSLTPDGGVELPFLAGERSPGWQGEARGLMSGLTLDTSAVEIARAMLESVALRLAIVYERLAPLAAPGHRVIASGGALHRSPTWAGIVADALGVPIVLAAEPEASSRGAALLALSAIAPAGADPMPE
ncbi:MAG TPA: FGGY-family carbohydrate kinase, partial [Candidatus Limnocylindrales bacterium]|nr:FGGY-family carbohydrate kinase [Candidatus Limnocylindrales bacterium]